MTCQAEAMPEKGWKIITVRKELHRKLVDLSTKEGVSIGELIESRLTSQLTSKLRRMEVEVSELTSELTSQKEEATLPNKPTKEPREQEPKVSRRGKSQPYRYTLSMQPKASNNTPWRMPSRLTWSMKT